MKLHNVFVVSITTNEEHSINVQVKTQTTRTPKPEELEPLVKKHLKKIGFGHYDFTIDNVVLLSNHIKTAIPFIGETQTNRLSSNPTVIQADKVGTKLHDDLLIEVSRLLNSGAIDPDEHHTGNVIAVALENIAARYANPQQEDYQNLKSF